MHTLGQLAVVEALLNTVDHDGGADAVATPDALHDWLAVHTAFGGDAGASTAAVSADDVVAAATLREAIRADIAARTPAMATAADPTAARARLVEVCSDHPLRLGGSADDDLRLVPVRDGARGALGSIVAAIAVAQLHGTWHRLKVCPGEGCGWAFVDGSRNCSRRWCDMRFCGNEAKVRAYRARRRADRP